MTRQIVCLGLLLGSCRLDEAGTGVQPVPIDGGTRDARAMPSPSGDPLAPDAAAPDPRPPAPGGKGPAPDAAPPPPPPDAAPPVVAGSPPCPDSPDLVFCARFEGAAIDESPMPLAVQGEPVRFVPGPSGLAAELEPGRHFTIAEHPRLDSTSITLQASVRPSSTENAMTVVENPAQYALIIFAGGNVSCSAGSAARVIATAAVQPGVWTRLHCVLADGQIVLWIDGERAGETEAPPLQTNRSLGLRIGWDDDPPRPYSGLIDDVRVWRAAHPPDAR